MDKLFDGSEAHVHPTKIRIEHVGNLYFVDYQLPNGDWKNYSSHATHTEALSEKAYLLSVFQEIKDSLS